jgi:hypothetical protein
MAVLALSVCALVAENALLAPPFSVPPLALMVVVPL